WNGFWGNEFVVDPMPSRALLGLGVTVLVLWVLGLAPPAWRALRRMPAPALQGRTMSEGPWGRRTRQALLTLQLSGAIALLVLAGVLTLQQRFLLRAGRGFETHNRLWFGFMVNPEKIPNLDAFVAALGRHPAIQTWSFGGGFSMIEDGGIDPWVGPGNHKQVMRLSTVSPRFF